MQRLNRKRIGQIFVLFLFYVLTARLGLALDAVGGFATLFWIPSGLSLAFVLLFGTDVWPGIFLGAFMSNYLNGAPLHISAAIATGNTAEALLGYVILNRLIFDQTLQQLRDILKLCIIAAPLCAIVSAVTGIFSLTSAGIIPPADTFTVLSAWWIGDVIGILIFTPFILSWRTVPEFPYSLKNILELLVLGGFTILMAGIVFWEWFGLIPNGSPVAFFLFPPLIWASMRFGIRGATLSVIALSIFSLIATIRGMGPFISGGLSERLVYLQSFMGVTVLTSLILAASEAERKQYDARKDEFISLASHELKTPITSIKTFTHVLITLQQNQKQTKAISYLKKMDIQINKLTNLISDLLDVSKIQAGKLDFHKEIFPLKPLIFETVETMRETTPTHTFQMYYPKTMEPDMVYCDRERLSQVLINLLVNAIKYSPGKNKIIIRITHEKDTVTVLVRDYGIGITKEDQLKLFTRYYRAGASGMQTFPGLGIGLYISNEIIKRNNGKNVGYKYTEKRFVILFFPPDI